MIRENNELHLELLKLKDEKDRVVGGICDHLSQHSLNHFPQIHHLDEFSFVLFSCLVSELKTHIRKLDHETTDLKFLNNQYVHKVRCLEKDSKAKSERIQQLQEKNLQAVVQTPGKGRGG